MDVQNLKSMYDADRTAHVVLNHLAHTRAVKTMTVDKLLSDLQGSLKREEVIPLLRQLQQAGCGQFLAGRRGHQSRFEWTVKSSEAGQAVSTTLNVAKNDDIAAVLKHSYQLRPNFHVELVLPANFNSTEADRLAAYIRTLPFTK